MLLVALVSRNQGFLLVPFNLVICDGSGHIKQHSQLLAAAVHCLLAGCTEPRVLCRPQRFCQCVDRPFQLGIA